MTDMLSKDRLLKLRFNDSDSTVVMLVDSHLSAWDRIQELEAQECDHLRYIETQKKFIQESCRQDDEINYKLQHKLAKAVSVLEKVVFYQADTPIGKEAKRTLAEIGGVDD